MENKLSAEETSVTNDIVNSEESETDHLSFKKIKKKGKKLIMNVALTKYGVVKKAATKYFG